MKEKIAQLKERMNRELQNAHGPVELEQLRVAYLGKKGSITELLKELKNVQGEDKKEMGRYINELKQEVSERLAALNERVQKEVEEARLVADCRYDISIPTPPELGTLHPVTIVQRELEQIFASMGFAIEDFSEVVTEYDNFEAVNVPKHHPARDMQDT